MNEAQAELTKIEAYLTDAWDMLEMKGATMPADGNKNTANLPAAIRSIPTGPAVLEPQPHPEED